MIAPVWVRLLFAVSVASAVVSSFLVWLKYGGPTQRGLDSDDILALGFASVLSVVVFCGWIGVVLASFGVFSLWLLAALLVLASLALLGLSRRRENRLSHVSVRHPTLVLLGLVALSCLAYFRPHEYVLGGSDAGSYVNTAAAVARTGSYVIHDDWQRLLVDNAAVTLREQPEAWRTRYLQFVGWYVDDHDPTRIVPQFFPFHPVLLAIGASIAGVKGSLLVTPIWGALDIVAVYLVARRLFGPRVAVLSAVFLAVTPTQIWFARYPTTEPLTLLLVFSAFLAIQIVWDGKGESGIIWGAFGGAALGAAFLTRIDLPLILLIVVGFLALRWLRGLWSTGFTAFSAVLIPLSLHATISAVLISWPYTWNTYRSVFAILRLRSIGAIAIVAVVALGVLVAVVWLALRRQRLVDIGRYVEPYSKYLRLAVVLALLALSIYAYFIRPNVSSIKYATSWPLGDRVPILNSQNWLRMGWYLTPLGILLATLGAAGTVYRESSWRVGLFMTAGILTTIQYQYNVFNMSYHIYVMRRYLPIVIPLLMIFCAYTVSLLIGLRGLRVFRLLGAGLVVTMVGALLYQSRFVLPQRDFHDLTDQLGTLNRAFDEDAIIVVAEPSDSALADRFGVPLRFIYNHPVATIRDDGPRVAPAIEAIMEYAQRQGRSVYLLASAEVPVSVRKAMELEPQQSVPIETHVLESTYFSYPSRVLNARWDLDVYRAVGTSSQVDELPSGATTIDIGGIDTLYLLGGFYEKEFSADGASLRWTDGDASVYFPAAAGELSAAIRVTTASFEGWRPSEVTVTLDGAELGRFTPTPGQWEIVRFAGVANPDRGYSTLEFSTATFSPSMLGLSDDARDLGVMLDWIEIAPIQK